MKTEAGYSAYQPRVVRKRIELWVPHNSKEKAFNACQFGPDTYKNLGKKILNANQQVTTGDYIFSLLHVAYGCTKEARELMNEPEFEDIRNIMENYWLYIFNRELWTDKGVYVVPDEDAIGSSKPLIVDDLEKMLKGGKELDWGGVRFSKDGKVRFAPKGSYNLGYNTSDKLKTDGYVIIISGGLEGAKKAGEVSAKFDDRPYIYGVEVQEGRTPEQRVFAIGGCRGSQLRLYGSALEGNDDGLTFAVY